MDVRQTKNPVLQKSRRAFSGENIDLCGDRWKFACMVDSKGRQKKARNSATTAEEQKSNM